MGDPAEAKGRLRLRSCTCSETRHQPSFDFMEYEEFEELQKSFMANVFPHFPPGPDRSVQFDSMWGYDAHSLFLKPASQAFVECFPAYRLDGNQFVHFTSLKALHAILNEYCVRLYSLSNANDPQEFTFLARHHEKSEHRLEWMKDTSYLLSMCEVEVLDSDNALDLWRLYGHDGYGVAIVFSVKMPLVAADDFLLARVSYGKHDYSDFDRRCQDFAQQYNRGWDVHELLRLPAVLHKHQAYRTEREVRLVKLDGRNPKKHPFDDSAPRYRCDYNSRHEVVNYFELPLQANNDVTEPLLQIDRIQLGFRHSDTFFRDFRHHLGSMLSATQSLKGYVLRPPSIELSPLRDIYR